MQIRPTTPADCAGIARVQVDSYRSAYAGLLPPAYLARFTYSEEEQDWRDLMAAGGADGLYVALDSAGDVLGYTLGRPARSPDDIYDGEVVALHVRREAQRQGVGRRLIAALANHLRQRGCSSLWLGVLTGNPAHVFYARLGGRRIGEQTIQIDAAGHTRGRSALCLAGDRGLVR